MESVESRIPTPFIWRRVHSLLGFWLVLYLFEHLLVNSQAALWIGDDGHTFVRLVNFIKSFPYLHAIELLLLGVPIVVHGVWGIQRLRTSKGNSRSSDGSKPSLPYGRNRAYSWQRITSWILLLGICAHVVQMRFIENPQEIEGRYLLTIRADEHLAPLAERLGVTVNPKGDREAVISAPTPGAAILLMIRDTFKNPLMVALYTIFVLAAAFHSFNGVWTFMITWGMILSYPSQKAMARVNAIGIFLLAFWGLFAIWGSYFS